jgi:hypothetical protein
MSSLFSFHCPESVSVKSEASENAGVIVCHAVSSRQPRVNLAVIAITTLKPETEAFRASEDRNASRIQDFLAPLLPAKWRSENSCV